MDANKLVKLRAIKYKILPTCYDCKHSRFNAGAWGICKIQTYQHLKHTGEPRKLSIYISGGCGKFKSKPLPKAWEEFRAT